jgi:hypothetical protein
MIVRYIYDFLMRALVERRILLGGLAVGASVLALAFFVGHDGLWRSAAAPSARAAAQPHEPLATPAGEAAPPAPAAMNPPPAIARPEPVQSEPNSTPGVDHSTPDAPDVDNAETLARRDRTAGHSSRTR